MDGGDPLAGLAGDRVVGADVDPGRGAVGGNVGGVAAQELGGGHGGAHVGGEALLLCASEGGVGTYMYVQSSSTTADSG